MVDIPSISAIVATAGVLVGVVYYILILRHNTKAKEMELSRMVISDFNSEQGAQRWATMMNLEWEDYDDFMKKYSSRSNPEMFSTWVSQLAAWEVIGFLIKRKVVKAETLYELGAWAAIQAWEKYKDIVQHLRDEQAHQDAWRNVEFLAQEMLRIKTEREQEFQAKKG